MNSKTVKATFNLMGMSHASHNTFLYWLPYSHKYTNKYSKKRFIIILNDYVKYRGTFYGFNYFNLVLKRINKDIVHDER